MKIKGIRPGLNRDVLVLDRPEGQIVFEAEAVSDYDEFHKLVPEPFPPEKILKGGVREKDFDSPDYKEAMEQWGTKQANYMVVRSLSVTEGLEWETVKPADPNTWHNWRKEMRESGLSDLEIRRVEMLVLTVNSLSEQKIQAARQHFLASKQARSG